MDEDSHNKHVVEFLERFDAITDAFINMEEEHLTSMWFLLNVITSGNAPGTVASHWGGVLRGVCRAKHGYDPMTRQVADKEFEEFQNGLDNGGESDKM